MAELKRGVYEHLITRELAGRLREVDDDLVQREGLDPADADELLSRHIAMLTRRALRAVPGADGERLAAQVAVANRIAGSIAALQPDLVDETELVDDAELVADPGELLAAIVERPPPPREPRFPVRPTTPLSTGALLVNGRNQPRIGHEVTYELADRSSVRRCATAASAKPWLVASGRTGGGTSSPRSSRCTGCGSTRTRSTW